MQAKRTIEMQVSGGRGATHTVRITVDTEEHWPAGERFRDRVEALARGGRLKPEGTVIEHVRVFDYVEETETV